MLVRRIETASIAKDQAGIRPLIAALHISLNSLFESEEALMPPGYLLQREHKQQHSELLNQVRCLAAVVRHGCIAAARYGARMLRISLQWHMHSLDRSLLEFQTEPATTSGDVRRAFRCDGQSHCLEAIETLPLRRS